MRSRTAARGILFVLAILAAPLAVGAQPAGRIPRIGWLMPNTPVSPIDSHITQAFRQGLRELGWIEARRAFFLVDQQGVVWGKWLVANNAVFPSRGHAEGSAGDG